MGKVILVCGRIGSGKTTYARKLASEIGAVNISHDEIMLGLFGAGFYERDPDEYGKYLDWVLEYVHRKVGEAARAGAAVICENGFWSREERDELKRQYAEMGVVCELHYMDTPEDVRLGRIAERNERVRQGELGYFLTNEKDLYHFFEVPVEDEVDVWVKT